MANSCKITSVISTTYKMTNNPSPGRERPAHPDVKEIIGKPILVYLTVCAEKRKKIFAQETAHKLLVESWKKADSCAVGKYVILPDHIHLFCAPTYKCEWSLAKWVQYWKALVSKKWMRPFEQPIWQKSFWDTQLRTNESYAVKWEYVRDNPVRERLVFYPELWPYQGELNVIKWFA